MLDSDSASRSVNALVKVEFKLVTRQCQHWGLTVAIRPMVKVWGLGYGIGTLQEPGMRRREQLCSCPSLCGLHLHTARRYVRRLRLRRRRAVGGVKG